MFKNKEVSIIPDANNTTRFGIYIFLLKNSIQFNLKPQRHIVNTYYNLDVNNITSRVVTAINSGHMTFFLTLVISEVQNCKRHI